jgi:hypothetical protein
MSRSAPGQVAEFSSGGSAQLPVTAAEKKLWTSIFVNPVVSSFQERRVLADRTLQVSNSTVNRKKKQNGSRSVCKAAHFGFVLDAARLAKMLNEAIFSPFCAILIVAILVRFRLAQVLYR